jgi:trans-aconitate 2-methyltransferase
MNDFWNATKYSRNSHMQYCHAREALKNYKFIGNENVLDVGCGEGKITNEIAKGVPNGQVIGIDYSESMIDFANKNFSSQQSNLEFNLLDANNLNFSEQFDLVLSFSCLHWIQDQHGIWLGMKKSLKKNGKAIVMFYKKHPHLWVSIERVLLNDEWAPYFNAYISPFNSFTVDLYKDIICQAGMAPILIEEILSFEDFESRAELENFLITWLPQLHRLPRDKHPEFVKQVCDNFLEIVPLNIDGNAKMQFIRIAVEAISCS